MTNSMAKLSGTVQTKHLHLLVLSMIHMMNMLKTSGLLVRYSISQSFASVTLLKEYQTRAVDDPIREFLSINGGLSGHSDSTTKKFYETFTTTDLMKSFDFVVDDHEGFAEPAGLSITCRAISKFLPYDGFYPVQRSVELAKQFYSSYKDNIRFTSGSTGIYVSGSSVYTDTLHAAQNILAPLFAPGILFNSIKSGVACDYPVISGSMTGSATITGLLPIDDYDIRIPFEAMVQPHKHLADVVLPLMENQISSSTDLTASWDGGGDQLYAKMANNFLGEVPNFFLDETTNSTIASKKNKDIFFVKKIQLMP